MNTVKLTLIFLARKNYNNILPIPRLKDFKNCFTEDFGQVIFWFNTPDESTHLISYNPITKTFKLKGKSIMTNSLILKNAKKNKVLSSLITPTKKISKYQNKKKLFF